MKQNSKKNKNVVRKIAIKAIARWMLFRAASIIMVVFSITAFWNEGLTLAQKIISIAIGIMFAAFPMLVKFDDILEDVITHERTKR